MHDKDIKGVCCRLVINLLCFIMYLNASAGEKKEVKLQQTARFPILKYDLKEMKNFREVKCRAERRGGILKGQALGHAVMLNFLVAYDLQAKGKSQIQSLAVPAKKVLKWRGWESCQLV